MKHVARSLVLACALLVVACSSDNTETDAGTNSRERDVPETEDLDAPSDVASAVDVIIDDAFLRPEVGADAAPDAVVDGGDEDIAAEDAEPEDTDPDRDVWGPLPETDDTVLLGAVLAARDALTSYCDCCNAAFASDPARCRANALSGGLELDECEVSALDTAGASAGNYLACMRAAFEDVSTCTPECSQVACLSCDSAFARAVNACNVASPTVRAILSRCE